MVQTSAGIGNGAINATEVWKACLAVLNAQEIALN